MTTDVLKLVRPETGAAFPQRHPRADPPRPRWSLLQARGRLALRGGLYVALQAAGVSAIAHGNYTLAIGVGFCISLAWTVNVKSVALGTTSDRVAYSAGAAIGTGIGMWVGTLL